ncbi:hypothetical protein RSPO_m00366 (plasmid) [Ralstonia solanacearum Po82]|uniref:Uncharacterized protein n=1 Tax=Ralstonia solanacearum (strain Po82) TaxID=1031711 RepID=F6G7K4_RALS8|nr:hypothetical protein RSPO_m00366 [Ralstonia solanacearum Po82]
MDMEVGQYVTSMDTYSGCVKHCVAPCIVSPASKRFGPVRRRS